MNVTAQHYWIAGGSRADRARVIAGLGLPAALLPATDSHRRLRGPYTAAGTLARALVPDVLSRDPDLVRRYDIELLSAAPELAAIVPSSRETLTSMAIPAERTRFYAVLRTRRISSGLAEFLRDGLPPGAPRTVIVENADHADATDLEFLAAAVRRIDPARLVVVVCSAAEDLADERLLAVLRDRARLLRVPAGPARDGELTAARPAGPDRARAYVQSDGTSDDPALLAAYEALPPAGRARLHEDRAAQLQPRDERSLRLGAIPYHLEHAADPRGAGVSALHAAQDYCLCLGFYEAAVDYGYRGLALVDPQARTGQWWTIANGLGLALSVLSRTREALALYEQARLLSIDPAVHMAAAYSTAMLYTRHNEPQERNEATAKSWLNAAIATASLVENHADRAFQSAFYRNGLALVEVNLGEPAEALRLVNECIDMLDRELADDEHVLHRSVLKNNRARVYLGLGRLDEALADYAVVIREDPHHAEHYLERGNILRRLGRYDEAADDYQAAMRLSPPFPEIYYNRGDLRLMLSDRAGAMADFSYALELDPEMVDAYVNRAGMYLDDGDIEAARADARAGLACEPGNPYLQVATGQVRAAAGDLTGAIAAYDRAIAADPALPSAWAGRAEALFEAGDHAQAIASLSQALEIAPDAALLFNRAAVHEAAGSWADALADLTRARQLDPADPDIQEQIARCRGQLQPG